MTLVNVETNEVMQATLEDCERVIARGMRGYIEAGQALEVIRDQRLYRKAGYADFGNYCGERWGWGRDYADRQIQSARVVRQLPTIVGSRRCWSATSTVTATRGS